MKTINIYHPTSLATYYTLYNMTMNQKTINLLSENKHAHTGVVVNSVDERGDYEDGNFIEKIRLHLSHDDYKALMWKTISIRNGSRIEKYPISLFFSQYQRNTSLIDIPIKKVIKDFDLSLELNSREHLCMFIEFNQSPTPEVVHQMGEIKFGRKDCDIKSMESQLCVIVSNSTKSISRINLNNLIKGQKINGISCNNLIDDNKSYYSNLKVTVSDSRQIQEPCYFVKRGLEVDLDNLKPDSSGDTPGVVYSGLSTSISAYQEHLWMTELEHQLLKEDFDIIIDIRAETKVMFHFYNYKSETGASN